MTVENENYREDYNGNDSATVFTVDFYFLDDTHLRVILTDSAGVSTDQVLDSDYSVQDAGEPSGGSVTMFVAPATGEVLTILRSVPLTQQYDYIENDPFPAESHETALDKLTMIVQQQEEVHDRMFTVEPAYVDTDVETVPLADSFLVWDDDGDELTNLLFSDINDVVEIEKLYLAGEVIVETFDELGSTGIKIHNGNGAEPLVIYAPNSADPGAWYMTSTEPGADFTFQLRNAADDAFPKGIGDHLLGTCPFSPACGTL